MIKKQKLNGETETLMVKFHGRLDGLVFKLFSIRKPSRNIMWATEFVLAKSRMIKPVQEGGRREHAHGLPATSHAKARGAPPGVYLVCISPASPAATGGLLPLRSGGPAAAAKTNSTTEAQTSSLNVGTLCIIFGSGGTSINGASAGPCVHRGKWILSPCCVDFF
jgi:hypothetical protein